MAQHMVSETENVWLDKARYEDAERIYFEEKAKPGVDSNSNYAFALEAKVKKLEETVSMLGDTLHSIVERVKFLESLGNKFISQPINLNQVNVAKEEKKGDDDVDLFGSDSEDDEAALEIRQKRLADYESRKSKKPVLIAKSNIILDVKPWDDETDMKLMENAVRAIQTEGLIWGASKLVPLAYGIHKLQISCVVEDDLVSVDLLQEKIEAVEAYVQSVDIAAFNKV